MKKIAILGGGTVFHVRPHLALSAPAYGGTARTIKELISRKNYPLLEWNTQMYLTRMAGGLNYLPETNEDISKLVDNLIADKETKIIFFTVAMCDFTANVIDEMRGEYKDSNGKTELRLKSDQQRLLHLQPAEKVIDKIRKTRKDIFLVGCKTTTSASVDEMFEAGLTLLKKASCNLVLVNDLHTRMNMIVTPEQAKYAVSTDRDYVLKELVDMTYHRSQLTFTKSQVIGDQENLVDWNAPLIPASLRTVVNYCVSKGAYKPFLGKTVGHFATKAPNGSIVTSIRKTDFNKLEKMVMIESTGKDSVIAYGAKPSVGGMSQRIIFKQFPELDCIVHFHCQLKNDSKVPVRSQREFECGSHECGKNTADGLVDMQNGIHAVMLDKHGPNIVFSKTTDPQEVIAFIDKNFDLSKQTSELI